MNPVPGSIHHLGFYSPCEPMIERSRRERWKCQKRRSQKKDGKWLDVVEIKQNGLLLEMDLRVHPSIWAFDEMQRKETQRLSVSRGSKMKFSRFHPGKEAPNLSFIEEM
jgi:hypothetical protein